MTDLFICTISCKCVSSLSCCCCCRCISFILFFLFYYFVVVVVVVYICTPEPTILCLFVCRVFLIICNLYYRFKYLNGFIICVDECVFNYTISGLNYWGPPLFFFHLFFVACMLGEIMLRIHRSLESMNGIVCYWSTLTFWDEPLSNFPCEYCGIFAFVLLDFGHNGWCGYLWFWSTDQAWRTKGSWKTIKFWC